MCWTLHAFSLLVQYSLTGRRRHSVGVLVQTLQISADKQSQWILSQRSCVDTSYRPGCWTQVSVAPKCASISTKVFVQPRKWSCWAASSGFLPLCPFTGSCQQIQCSCQQPEVQSCSVGTGPEKPFRRHQLPERRGKGAAFSTWNIFHYHAVLCDKMGLSVLRLCICPHEGR